MPTQMMTFSRVILSIARVTVSSALSAMSRQRIWLRWPSIDRVLDPLSRSIRNGELERNVTADDPE